MRSYVNIYVVMACALSSFVGCNKPQEQASENVQLTQEASESPATDAKPSEAPATEVKTCGPTTLAVADAEKWECVPESGYWCTDPKGCPVNGNIAVVGTRLAFAQPLPQGTGYHFDNGISDCDHKEDGLRICSDADWTGWSCTRSEGCDCGAGKVKMDGKCLGDTYRGNDGLSSETCNKDNCGGAFCRNNQCVCGEKILTENNDECHCPSDKVTCLKTEGCIDNGKNYAYYQTWIDYRYEKTSYREECDAIRPSEITKDNAVPKGYVLSSDKELKCAEEEGCSCGKQICPKGFICEDDRCVTWYDPVDQCPGMLMYYCDEACDCDGRMCPKNAFCLIESGGIGSETDVRCENFEEVTDARTAFAFYKYLVSGSDYFGEERYASNYDVYFHNDYSDDKDENYTNHVIFDIAYWGKRKNEYTNYYLKVKEGKKIDMYVVCSKPGCDCNGSPLDEHYYCIQQHVVLASGEPDMYGTCSTPYQPFTYDEPSSFMGVSCDISENIVEPVCFNSEGCACGSTTIAEGDVCVNGQARCSTLHSRPGCLCGDKTLQKGYGCYKGSLMCQSEEACKCRGTDIHYGDICDENKVICGTDSSTPGCLCAGKALKKGYRCFEEKQLCDCKNPNDNADKAEKECKCKCGKSEIANGEECENNKPVIIPKAEIIENENGDTLLKCGNEMVNIGHVSYGINELRYSNGNAIDIDKPDDREGVCTCGTGKPAPGEGYGCAFEATRIGAGSEGMNVLVFAGWRCLNKEGCQCGDSICYPDLWCRGDNDKCDEEDTLKLKDGQLDCEEHVLPAEVIVKGYGCYSGDVNAPGWYCAKPEGCPCGEVTCEQNQMCLAPGYCSKNKLNEQEQERIEFLQIKRVACNDYC